ncbi:MAG: hypothetical protein U0401_08585 [Anaerolineae bacterium]
MLSSATKGSLAGYVTRAGASSFAFRAITVQTEPEAAWVSALKTVYETSQPQAGRVYAWENVSFTGLHQRPNLTMGIQWAEAEPEPLCLISNLPLAVQPHLLYQTRYWIETLFSNCKSRGFALGRCQMTTPAHIDRLLLAVVGLHLPSPSVWAPT